MTSPELKLPIYMDCQATTPVDPRVIEAMLPYFQEKFGNAASRSHAFGWSAKKAVDEARAEVARLLGARAEEIVFTSGATESNNLAIKGIAERYRSRGNHIVSQVTEHKAVLDPLKHLEERGFRITLLPVDSQGLVDPHDLEKAIGSDTILVTIMSANNEIGVLQPVEEIGALCRERGVFFHSDAVQAVGKVPMDVGRMNLDCLSLTAHKIYGPKGAGALYVRRGQPPLEMAPQIDGGGHERGLRSGTLNVPGIVGLGEACRIARQEMEAEAARLTALRDRLLQRLQAGIDRVRVNGSLQYRLPGNLNMSFLEIDGQSLLMAVDDVALSSGSACTSASLAASYVLRSIGLDEETAQCAIRFGLGRFNTEAEVDYVASKVAEAVRDLREFTRLKPAEGAAK